jgi:hypothetical protein
MNVGEGLRGVSDRFWLFTIAAIVLAIVGFIAVSVIWKGAMPRGAGELLGSIVTGGFMLAQKVVDAQQQRRMADQLHQSSPSPAPPAPDQEGPDAC